MTYDRYWTAEDEVAIAATHCTGHQIQVSGCPWCDTAQANLRRALMKFGSEKKEERPSQRPARPTGG